MLTVGIWMHLNRGPYVTLLPNSSFLSATTLTIAAGAIIFIVGFCGCCSAMMESQCMLVVVSYCSMGKCSRQQIDDIFCRKQGFKKLALKENGYKHLYALQKQVHGKLNILQQIS